MSTDDAQGVRSVQRALDIMGLLTEDRPSVTLREITEATGLAKTTVLRIVQTLEQNGMLWASNGAYLAGPGMWRWAHLARYSWELPPETRKIIKDLATELRETVNLYMARGLHRVVVAQQESPQPLRHVVHVGDELPLWSGASSKILLHGASEDLLSRIASTSPYGPGHVRRMREWEEEAAHRGWAVSHGEREQGLSAAAVPVLSRSGAIVAALSVSGPTVRFDDEAVSRFAEHLVAAARHISERGFDHPFAAAM